VIMTKIPSFTCKPGCHGCCGIVPFTTKERDRVAAIRPMEQWTLFQEGAWVPTASLQTMSCPFLNADGCGIYEQRPMVCRLFGAVDDPRMTCLHGCGPAKKLTERQSRELIARTA
jgi:Fe-S-cluster containining protein